jgi:hypothetical protein
MTDPTKPGDPADKAADGAFGGVTSHRAGYGDRLARVEEWLRKHPSATLASGEGAVLLAEIDRLRVENCELRGIRLNMGRGINMLRAAIDRVRALHRSGFKGVICDGCAYYYPCLTIRALDGEGA